ncbi:unnamed protein product [Rhizophagus irregularis]|nr:unnamed protein product [Rhizophagus irregularis]
MGCSNFYRFSPCPILLKNLIYKFQITKLQLPIGTNIPLPKINPNRLTIEELKKKLSDYGIDTDIISDNRVVLAEILQNISNDETSKQVSDMLYNETIDTDLDSRQVSEYKLDFSLSSGWALKENQRFGKKGGGKRMSKNVVSYLEAYFLAGDINKSEKIYGSRNAEMHNELKGLVEGGILEKEEIPKIFTISNWIARYLVKYENFGIKFCKYK